MVTSHDDTLRQIQLGAQLDLALRLEIRRHWHAMHEHRREVQLVHMRPAVGPLTITMLEQIEEGQADRHRIALWALLAVRKRYRQFTSPGGYDE